MKTTLKILSVQLAALMACAAMAQEPITLELVGGTDKVPVHQPDSGIMGAGPAALLMATMVAAGIVIIWLYIRNGNDFTGKRLILERDCQCGTWTAIATNCVAEGSNVTNKWTVFRAIINSPTNDFCRFRIKVESL